MRILIAAVLSAALLILVPTPATQINNSTSPLTRHESLTLSSAEQEMQSRATPQVTKQDEAVAVQNVKEVEPEAVTENKTVTAKQETDIPAQVFCGSPEQLNTKNINTSNALIGKQLAQEYGWTGNEWKALLELWSCESSWNHAAINPTSGAGGIPQSWPASKMASAGADYQTNPTTQIAWGLKYISSRYDSPSDALSFHYSKNYY
jgi:hypothetical protein